MVTVKKIYLQARNFIIPVVARKTLFFFYIDFDSNKNVMTNPINNYGNNFKYFMKMFQHKRFNSSKMDQCQAFNVYFDWYFKIKFVKIEIHCLRSDKLSSFNFSKWFTAHSFLQIFMKNEIYFRIWSNLLFYMSQLIHEAI